MKNGISLIVLVITIIVMIILAASVVITLSNTGIINKTSQAVDLTNEVQVQDMASLIWSDAYMDNKRGTALETEVKNKLKAQGIEEDKWDIDVTDVGVIVTGKDDVTISALGSLISKDNYGDTVDYSVTVNGITYADWQIYYHNEDYVYLVSSSYVEEVALDKGITVASLTAEEVALYEKFRVGNNPKYTLVDKVSGSTSYNSQAVAQLIKDYAGFANIQAYGSNVVGAIGGPTLELLVAGWNAKEYSPTLALTTDEHGYKINDKYSLGVTTDGLYVPTNYYYRLASPAAAYFRNVMYVGYGYVNYNYNSTAVGIRPVVCLKSSIPATVGTGDYDFSLIK